MDNAPAPTIMLNTSPLTSVEMPGPVQESSLPRVLGMLGGGKHFSSVLASHAGAPNATESVPELAMRPDNPFAHPVTGSVINTSNLLLRVVKRRRKIRRANPTTSGDVNEPEEGVFSVESLGVINRTVRFRDLQDYQYQPDMNDPLVALTNSMRNLEVQPILDYAFPEPVETDPSGDLKLFPPPVFSRISLPQNYGFKKNPQTKVETVTNARGEEVERLRNNTRYALVPPQTVNYADDTIPDKPAEGVKEGPGTEASLIARIKELLAQRPVWGRTALLNQLSLEHYRTAIYQKQALPYLTYTFNDGPFREMLSRLGYDPRKDPEARVYQRIQLRNALAPKQSKKNTAVPTSYGSGIAQGDPRPDLRSHVFDGVHCAANHPGTYQLVDLTDTLLFDLVHDTRYHRSTCHPVDGWFVRDFLDHLRNILKQKFTALVTTNEPLDDTELVEDVDRMRRLPREGEGDESGSEAGGARSESDGSNAGGDTGKKRFRPAKKTKKPTAKTAVGERKRPDLLNKTSLGGEEDGTQSRSREASQTAGPSGQGEEMSGVEPTPAPE